MGSSRPPTVATLWERDIMHRIAVVATSLSLAFAGTSESIAATINVPGDYENIQDAIFASTDGDVIIISAGIYHQSSINPDGNAITIRGTLNADGSLATTIMGGGNGYVFAVDSGEGEETVLKDLIITGGNTESGGGIYCANSNPTITGCTVESNVAANMGGGIYCTNSNPTITGCTITDNQAGYAGGGIYCDSSSPTISGCTISGNIADFGGGICCYYSSTPIITNCTITGNNIAWYAGGGIDCNYDGAPTVSNSQICGNAPDQINGNYSDEGGNCLQESCDDCEDSDGDGVYDHNDAFPEDPSEWADSDSDGVGDNADICPDGDDTVDSDGDGIPDDCESTDACPADADGNSVVDVIDLLAVIDGWGTDSTDLNDDGTTDVFDLLAVIDGWGPCD